MPRTAVACGRFSLLGRWSNQRQIVNVLEARVIGNETGTRAQELQQYADQIAAEFELNIIPRLSNNYTLEQIDWIDLNSVTGPTGTSTFGLPVTGPRVEVVHGPAAAMLVTKALSTAGRGSRDGRWFVSPPPGADISENGDLLLAAQALHQTAFDNFWDGLQTLSVGFIAVAAPVVIQWPSISVPQPAKKAPDPDGVGVVETFGQFVVETTLSTQRRRQRP